jgi:hypothetical protein
MKNVHGKGGKKTSLTCSHHFEQVVASASLLTEDTLKSGIQKRYFIPSTSKRKERLLKPEVVAVEASRLLATACASKRVWLMPSARADEPHEEVVERSHHLYFTFLKKKKKKLYSFI